MKTLYIECNMGAAGDMLMAALCGLCDEPQKFINELNALGIPGVGVSLEKTVKCGISGLSVHVSVNGKEELHLIILDDSVPAGSQLC